MIKEFVPLRFVLIVMIFLHHATNYVGGGSSAVATFFVLSGFCMTLGYRQSVLKDDFSYKAYLKKRLLKIYPLHWISLTTMLLIMCVTCDTLGRNLNILINALLLQSWSINKSTYFSYNAVSWYLSVTVFTMVCFPVIITFIERLTNKERLVSLVGLIVGYFLVAMSVPLELRHAVFYIHPIARLMDFIIGIALAYIYLLLKNKPRVSCWVGRYVNWLNVLTILSFGILVGISLVVTRNVRLLAISYWLPIAVLILLIALSSEKTTLWSKILTSRFAQWTTQCSFSFMMWHQLVIRYSSRWFGCANGGGAMLLLQFAISYVIAQISYYLIEVKLNQWIQTKF